MIDATNAVRTPPPDGFPTVGAYVRSLLPTGVHLAKAFNTIGAEHLSTGRLGGAPAFLPLAGDRQACAVATSIAAAIGFEAADLGGPEMIEMVEDHARLWIHLALSAGWGRNFGFAVTRT